MHSPGGRSFFTHVTSWRFVLTLACLFVVDGWLETTTIAERATLGGFDTAREFSEPQDGTRTAVVGISGLETAKYFAGKRPIPAESLAKVVTRLMRLRPRVLVVDVFTDGADYRRVQLTDSLVLSEQKRIVWAQSADTATGEMMPVLGGAPNPPGRTGLAAILADKDRLVRRFRPRYASSGVGPASELIESLPLAAANAFVADGRDSARITKNVPHRHGLDRAAKLQAQPAILFARRRHGSGPRTGAATGHCFLESRAHSGLHRRHRPGGDGQRDAQRAAGRRRCEWRRYWTFAAVRFAVSRFLPSGRRRSRSRCSWPSFIFAFLAPRRPPRWSCSRAS